MTEKTKKKMTGNCLGLPHTGYGPGALNRQFVQVSSLKNVPCIRTRDAPDLAE